jgi:hypothetical protein
MYREGAGPGDVVMQKRHFAIFWTHVRAYATHRPPRCEPEDRPHKNLTLLRGPHRRESDGGLSVK